MRRRWVPIIWVVLTLGSLSGCLDGPSASEGDARTGPSERLPPGCDRDLAVVVHSIDAIQLDADGAALPVPCASSTGSPTLEPTLGVTSTGRVVLGPAHGEAWVAQAGTRTQTGVAISTDEGGTWERVVPAIVADQDPHLVFQDPYLYVDPLTDRIFYDDIATVNCSVLSWSDDGGSTWSSSASGCMETDHQTLFAGPPVNSDTIGYPNIVYRCAISGGALADASTAATCQRSLDGGRTWLPPGAPAFVTEVGGTGHYGRPWCDGATGHGVTDSAGTVYLPKGLCGQPWLAISHDEGLTWERAQVADIGMRSDEDGAQSHEAGVGVDSAGNVYFLWVAQDRLPYLAVSADGGRTWGTPMMVGPPGLTQSSLPALIVGGEGRLAISYIGSTNAPSAPFDGSCDDVDVCLDDPAYEGVTWNAYLAMTTTALDDAPRILTATINDPADPIVAGYCGGISCQEVADFIDVWIGPDGTPWGSYVDGCTPEECTPNGGGRGIGLVGRLWGGGSLWSEDDPNGPYPDVA